LEDFEAYEFVEGEFKVKGKATYVAYIWWLHWWLHYQWLR
jgi:hypothetical protein